MTPAEFSRGSL